MCASILRVLEQWDRLPESDLVRRLPPPQAARYHSGLLRALAGQGHITVRWAGDERVVQLARPRGAPEPPTAPPSAEPLQ